MGATRIVSIIFPFAYADAANAEVSLIAPGDGREGYGVNISFAIDE